MARVARRASLNPRALERRTQAIGRELFQAAKRRHAHLSTVNRWARQVLSWCLGDPLVKSSLLQFIDVLPSLADARAIARHVHEYFPSTQQRLPAALRLGGRLGASGLLTAPGLAGTVRQITERVASQFIAQSGEADIGRLVQRLGAQGLALTVDVLGEQVLSDAEADAYAAEYRRVLRGLAAAYEQDLAKTPALCAGPAVNLSVKPSALAPRFDPLCPEASLDDAAGRLGPLLDLAEEHAALINLDIEQYELRDLTIALAQRMLGEHPPAAARLGVAFQAYLRDAEACLDRLLEWLRGREGSLTIRLVKGAYWDAEVALARRRHWPVPVYEDKAETDASFERLTRRLLEAVPLVGVAIGSHNVRSIAHAMACAEALGLERRQVEFQLLYGMGDALQEAILARGYPVRIYTPVGELLPGMAYLVRRILENTANESFLRQDWLRERALGELLAAPSADRRPGAMSARGPTPQAAPRAGFAGEPMRDFSRAEQREAFARAISEVRRHLGRRYQLLIGEREAEGASGRDVRNPAVVQQQLGLIDEAGPDEVQRAVRLAAGAQAAWAATPVTARGRLLRHAAQLLRARRDSFAAWEVLEVGKTWREADADVVEAIEYLEYYSAGVERLAAGRALPQFPGEQNLYRYVPRGPAAVIAPWNFPLAILTGMASAALAAGNTAILKPAGQSSIIAWHFVRLLREAGIAPEVVQLLPGPGEEVGAALVAHPQVAQILFTGSRAVGLSIIEAAARTRPGQRHVKHVVVEMGGKNAIVVDADADLDAAVRGSLVSSFGYGGQKCSAASRLIAHEAVYERFLSRFVEATKRLVVGDPADPATDVGPLIDLTAQRRLREAAARAAQVGRIAHQHPEARLPREGYFVGPAIVTDVAPTDPLATEELFGPLVCVFRVEDFDAGLALANDTDYALTGGVYSRSPGHIERAAEAFDVGNLYINRQITGALVGRQPFGGHRLSGLGTKAGGPDYLLHLLIPKTICTDTTRHGTPLE